MTKEGKCNIIIPSSKLVAVEMQNEFGTIPPVLIPVMRTIALKKILETYVDAFDNAYVGIQESADATIDYFKFFPDQKVKLVKLSESESISDTIEKIAECNPKIKDAPIILNFADTIVKDLDKALIGKDFISYAETVETERWTLFKEKNGEITEISDKKYQLNGAQWKTFVGVWGFSNATRLLELIHQENCRDKSTGFYRALSQYADEHPLKMVESEEWVDLGHVDNYYAARKKEINTRYFNRIHVNEATGTVIKTSTNYEKLRNEINWYITIPKILKYYTPTIFSFSLSHLKPFVEMEFYSYPSLDDYFVYAKVDLDTWEKIFTKLFSILGVASKYTVKDNDIKLDLKNMYLDKTIDRLELFSKENPALYSLGNDAVVDGKKLVGLKEVVKSLPNLIEQFRLYDAEQLQVIHGDLCLNNILYDNKHGIIKLIDPRGEFGRHSIYGDVYYDLAKLAHSILGFYDLIMFDQFKFESGTNQKILWRSSPYNVMLGKIFQKHIKKAGFDLSKIRFAESLLFLSMLPLHKDRPNRQHAMMINGLSILTSLIEDKKA
jgi:hypothetical protein